VFVAPDSAPAKWLLPAATSVTPSAAGTAISHTLERGANQNRPRNVVQIQCRHELVAVDRRRQCSVASDRAAGTVSY
jgi:hypothetical protein